MSCRRSITPWPGLVISGCGRVGIDHASRVATAVPVTVKAAAAWLLVLMSGRAEIHGKTTIADAITAHKHLLRARVQVCAEHHLQPGVS